MCMDKIDMIDSEQALAEDLNITKKKEIIQISRVNENYNLIRGWCKFFNRL